MEHSRYEETLVEENKIYQDNPYLFKYNPNQIFWRCILDNKISNVINFCYSETCGGNLF